MIRLEGIAQASQPCAKGKGNRQSIFPNTETSGNRQNCTGCTRELSTYEVEDAGQPRVLSPVQVESDWSRVFNAKDSRVGEGRFVDIVESITNPKARKTCTSVLERLELRQRPRVAKTSAEAAANLRFEPRQRPHTRVERRNM